MPPTLDDFRLDIGQSLQSGTGRWYRNLQVLGAGGNAVTFLTVCTSGPHSGNLFAVKVFRKLSRPERRESFLAEMQFLKSCDHPGIMRVFDSGVFLNDHPFFVAEYLPQTLAEVIRARSSSIVARSSFALQLVSALSYLETLDRPVVHRDIKPQNVFVKGRSCVLGDFGLIKHIEHEDEDDRRTFKQSAGVGMPFFYRTPDQVSYLVDGIQLTTKSDVFQLGLLLAELFTGRNPELRSDDFTSPVELTPLSTVPGSLGAGIASLIRRMLHMDPQQRESASTLLPAWHGVFKSAVERAHALEGRVPW